MSSEETVAVMDIGAVRSTAPFVQIAVAMAEERRGATGGAFLYALDANGDVWQYERGGLRSAKWVPLNTERRDS